ncbi:MAG: acetyl-CoA carboxylase biotin carboxyl carrier protein [Planctomycetaceae bacterium]|jgi:acetyl-CoA carboxylase biotin carboxyl carrier protein|nr:acetyl-CoA carboxylase biotin carboxyl carrier protein [Planctomycetaceae bacterium]
MANIYKNNNSDVFDIKQIERLVDLMKSNDLSEILLQQGDIHIQLKRNVMQQLSSPVVPQVIYQAEPNKSVSAEKRKADELKEKELDDNKFHVIRSPMVGTFYAASSPDSLPLVKVGDTVTPEKTICLIEAMKVFNEIQAECSGKIAAILVKNGEAVEYGKPLFKVTIE